MTFLSQPEPGLDLYWRSIILFGRNVASYKFALGKSLLELASAGQTFIRMDELAVPFARHITDHLKLADQQGTSRSSKFLDACRNYNRGVISADRLRLQTTRLGFTNVIDAFHIVNSAPLPVQFFVDERSTRGGIVVTDHLLRLAEHMQFSNLPHEVEARWRLVETAWSLDIPTNLLEISYDPERDELYTVPNDRRVSVTSSRSALNGYQKGACFYCFADIAIDTNAPNCADVDHFLPRSLGISAQRTGARQRLNLDGIWNLVLACRECNRGEAGKFARLPARHLLERLDRRNNFYVESHHPLRETLLQQTGETTSARRAFLEAAYWHAAAYLNIGTAWTPPQVRAPVL
jgi:5-methylcytosine-specific restriction endonuclease McrA